MGDELAEIDPAPGEAHNYFALLEILPGDLLRRIIKDKGCSPTALKVASILGVDLVNEVFRSCIPVLSDPASGSTAQSKDKTARATLSAVDSDGEQGSEGGSSCSSRHLEHDKADEPAKIWAEGNMLDRGRDGSAVKGIGPLGPKKLEGHTDRAATLREGEREGSQEVSMSPSEEGNDSIPDECSTASEVSGASMLGSHAEFDEDPGSSCKLLCSCLRCTAAYSGLLQNPEFLREHQSAAGTGRGESLLHLLLSCGSMASSGGTEHSAASSPSSDNRPSQALDLELDAADIDKAIASKSNRLPGIYPNEENPGSLTLDLLEKLAAIAPLRSFVAAIFMLFSRNDSLYEGFIPLLPHKAESSHSTKDGRKAGSSRYALDSLNPRFPIPSTSSNPEGRSTPASDSQLRDFAIKIAAERYPVLHRWLLMQLETCNGLSHLQPGTPPGWVGNISLPSKPSSVC